MSLLCHDRFYGRNSSYVHGGLDSNGKLAEAVYGQAVSVNNLKLQKLPVLKNIAQSRVFTRDAFHANLK